MSEKDVNNPQEEKGVRAAADGGGNKGREDDSDTGKKNRKQGENVEASNSGKAKKEYKTEELRRLQEVLRKERSHIRKPRQREHFPFVWTSLEPYYNTQTAAFLIDLPEEFRHSYVSRSTAIGLCDPWVDLEMDNTILPKIGSAQRTSTRGQERTRCKKSERSESQEREKEKKEKKGSTRLPKFPVVPFHTGKENATQRFPYQDIPKFRQEMDQRFSLHAPKKVDSDYRRTKDDFYRMDLDKLDEVHPINRPHMRKAYFAYLQNTPGSKKAITECVRSLDTSVKHEQQQQPTGTPQKAS